MMHKVTASSLIVSFSVLMIGTTGSWLYSENYGHEVSSKILKFCLTFVCLAFAIKLYIYRKAKKYLLYQLLFIAILGVDLAWFATCPFLPLFWSDDLNLLHKLFLVYFYLCIIFFNVKFAIKNFESQWRKFGAVAFDNICTGDGAELRWKEVSKSMKLTASIFVPGLPKKAHKIMIAISFILMLTGYVLRTRNPDLSMMALSIPCTMCAACCLQMSCYRFAEVKKIKFIECSKKIKLDSI